MINDLLLSSLTNYYKKGDHIIQLKNIINHPKISLRLIDWFTTNYSKKYNVIYLVYKDNQGDLTLKETNTISSQFNVYNSYKSQLKAYSKKQFDPFCRRERISFFDHNNNELITTVGQLNFFRWAIENKILEFIIDNFSEIENDMNNSLRNLYKKTDSTIGRRKRTELSISATKTVNKHDVSIVVQFD